MIKAIQYVGVFMKKMMHTFSWKSLKGKMLIAFMVTAVIPTCILIFFSYINTVNIVRDNVDELLQKNIAQIKSSMDVWIDSYEDILFQIYMNDDIVDVVEDINDEEDITMKVGQLRRTLRGMFYTKEHIKCITVITETGKVVFYDLLTGAATQTSWMEKVGLTKEELYDYFSADNGTHMLPTKEAGTFASETYYLFHLGHRIIDYRDVEKPLGVVIISVDESMLQEISGDSGEETGVVFMVDTKGNMVSSHNKELLGTKVIDWSDDMEERKAAYGQFWEEHGRAEFGKYMIQVAYNEEFGVDIVCISSQKALIERLDAQQKAILLVMVITLLAIIVLVVMLTGNLMKSINRVVKIMQIAETGNLAVRAEEYKDTPTEIRIIEKQFNHMMGELESSIEKEKEANIRQRNAEIAALEAQINPHFLYNTLDTINWMAIDKDEYEISNSITSLAKILRYGIDNSNGEVTVQQEVEWLKQYLFLQQVRLKSTFECEINVSPELLGWKVHKLLLQPFVENTILHGFKTDKGLHILRISMEPEETQMRIRIWDNGKGMSPEMVKLINHGEAPKGKDKDSIGMKNAINRIQMYYGEKAVVQVESCEGEYTSIEICLPKIVD